MTPVTRAKLAFAVIGIIFWAYGAHVDERHFRLIGIGCFAASFFLRFFERGSRSSPEREESANGGTEH